MRVSNDTVPMIGSFNVFLIWYIFDSDYAIGKGFEHTSKEYSVTNVQNIISLIKRK